MRADGNAGQNISSDMRQMEKFGQTSHKKSGEQHDCEHENNLGGMGQIRTEFQKREHDKADDDKNIFTRNRYGY